MDVILQNIVFKEAIEKNDTYVLALFVFKYLN